MRDDWSLLPPVEPDPALAAAVGGHPIVAYLLAQRGLTSPEEALAFLDPAAYRPAPPTTLHGVAEAAEILYDATQRGQHILVWGDFDVDGQTSTSLLVAALRRLAGDACVRYHVPNRFTESHGMRLPKLQELLNQPDFRPDVILTCDTGITDAEAVGVAKDQGLTVIITDHHDLPPELQEIDPAQTPIAGRTAAEVGAASVRRADAIVNPKLQAADDPLRTLPGVGVAYKLVQQLYTLAGIADEAVTLLDLVALGIVADVAEQVHDARYLLQLGLQQLRRTRRTGLLALMHIARTTPEEIDTETIGFQIGPRMNALGRIDDATVAVELLTTRDAIRAGQLAARMDRLNQQRRLLTSQMTAMAMEILERRPELHQFGALVLNHPAWHAGIVGIVASRLVEEYHKPTVLLLNPPGEMARGSARSVPGVDIGAAIAACGHLLEGYGGHPGAAGLSLNPDNIDRFRRELDRQIELHRTPEAPPRVVIDAELSLDELDLPLAEQVQRLAPFGNGNPMPKFLSRGLSVVEEKRLGRDGNHRRLLVEGASGAKRPVLWFNSGDSPLPSGPLDLVYTIGINTFRGERSLQLMYVDSQPAERPTAVLRTRPTVRVHDLRHKEGIWDRLPPQNAAVWYAEGMRLDATGDPVTYAPRTADGLPAGAPLVVYSVPPSPAVLRWLYERYHPPVIYLVGRLTSDDSLEAVVRHVAGMCKFALGRDRRLSLVRMAARLGQTSAVMHQALRWLHARGQISLAEWESDDVVILAAMQPGDSATTDPANGDSPELLQAQLAELLAEVRAYRRYFLRARTNELGLPVAI